MHKEMIAFRTIREVAEIIDVPQHVLRFWETRFPEVKPLKHNGGRRYYSPEDIELLKGIHHLLYGEGYTIRGVQKVLREEGPHNIRQVGSSSFSKTAPSALSPTSLSPAESLVGQDVSSTSDPVHSASRTVRETESPLLPLDLPFKTVTEDSPPPVFSSVRSLPKSPLPPVPKAPLPPAELFLGFTPNPTPRAKMGDDSHFPTSTDQKKFLHNQLREALNHLKECKQKLSLVITSERNSS